MKKVFFLIVAVPLLFTLFSLKVKAAVIEKEYNRVYQAQDQSVKVIESKIIRVTQPSWYIPAGTEETFIIFNPTDGDPKQTVKLKKTLSSIRITDSNGLKLTYSSETTSGKNLLIKVRFPTNVNYGSKYTLTLSYTSFGLLIKSGSIRDFYVPGFSKDYKFVTNNSSEKVSTNIKVPTSYGEINFSSPSQKVVKSGNFWSIQFPQTALVGKTGWIQIGKTQYYSFDIKQPHTSSTSIPFPYNTYKLVIPRGIKTGHIDQKVYFTNITPEPRAVYEDNDGNLIAEFRVPANESGELRVAGYATLEDNMSYDITKSGTLAEINKTEFQTDLASAKYWESNATEIQQAAQQIKGDETDVYKLIQKTYNYVIAKIDYSDVKKFGLNQRQGALATLRGGAAVCMEYSDLFIALMRSMGVPARGAFGHAYSAIDYLSTQDNSINHQWAEVYVPGVNSWIPVDTTWGESGPALIGGDLNHFYSHVASVDPDTPSTTEVSFYGFTTISTREDNIAPVDKSFTKNKEVITEEELVAKYPKDNSIGQFISDTGSSINLFLHTLDQKVDAVLLTVITTSALRTPVKLIVEILPFIILIVVVLIILKRRKKLKLSI